MRARELVAGLAAAAAFGLLLPVPNEAHASVYADFDGDTRSDVLWRNSGTGHNYVFLMNGLSIVNEDYLRTVPDQIWQVAGLGDFDGDGKADILWRNSATGENYVFLMNGLSIVNEGYLRTVADTAWQIAGVGDFDGDGRADILWRNSTSGENYLYLMSGTSIIGEGYLHTVSDQNWRIAGSGDFDGDGRSDILWRNAATGENYVYLMNGTSIIGEGYLRTVSNLDWKVVGVGDFNGDGRDDILWRNASTGENYLYPMNGTTILGGEGYLRTVADTAWNMVQVGDFDGDGRADILWRNSSSGENYVYLMDETTIAGEGYLRTVTDQNWKVQYPSSQGPAPAPGTLVTLMASADNTLYESATGNSNGAGPHFYAGRTASFNNTIRRALLKFDLSGIPAGSTINSATLTLHVSNTGPASGAHGMALHRVLAGWGEGTSNPAFEGQGAPATTNDATWLHRFFPSIAWTNPGGDFAATQSAATAVSGIGNYSWSGDGMTADVQQWLADPATNFGWLLRGSDETITGSAKEFASRENATAGYRPQLVINFTAPQ